MSRQKTSENHIFYGLPKRTSNGADSLRLPDSGMDFGRPSELIVSRDFADCSI